MATSFSTAQPIQQWPVALKPNLMTLHLQSNTSAFVSPYTRSAQTQELPGQLFTLALGFPPLDMDKAGQARALLARLRGQAGRFYFPVQIWGRVVPSAYAAEQITIIPLSIDNDTLTADSTSVRADATQSPYQTIFTADGGGSDPVKLRGTLWLNSGRAPLKVGGYISYDDPTLPLTAGPHRCLHLVVGITNEAGATILTLEPPMLVRPTASTPIHNHNPSGVFRLSSDADGAMTQRVHRRFDLGFSAVQARPVMFSI